MTKIKRKNLSLRESLCVSPAISLSLSLSVGLYLWCLSLSLCVSVAVSLSSLTSSSICTSEEKCAIDKKALERNMDICRNGSAEY